jgi:hypothetical protein
MRQVLTIVVPLVVPAVLYILYLYVTGRRARAAGQAPSVWKDVPWTWLGIAGAFLVIVTFAAYALFGGSPPGSRYDPAKTIDGQIQPGGFE